jgi:hypothetical protein
MPGRLIRDDTGGGRAGAEGPTTMRTTSTLRGSLSTTRRTAAGPSVGVSIPGVVSMPPPPATSTAQTERLSRAVA